MDKTIFHRKVETMKKTMFIFALVSLAILVGCKKERRTGNAEGYGYV